MYDGNNTVGTNKTASWPSAAGQSIWVGEGVSKYQKVKLRKEREQMRLKAYIHSLGEILMITLQSSPCQLPAGQTIQSLVHRD